MQRFKLFFNFADILRCEIKNDFDKIAPPKIQTGLETIQTLLESNKSFIRFGDGEYIIMEGGGIAFQEPNEKLAKTLQEIILSNDENLLIGLGYGYFRAPTKPELVPFKYAWVTQNFHILKKYLIEGKEYGSTGITPAFDGSSQDKERHFTLVKRLFINKKILVICGDKVISNTQYNIFEDAKNEAERINESLGIKAKSMPNTEIAYLYGATKHAYKDIESLKTQILNFSTDWTLVFALGPAGKALGYEMFKVGYRVLDVGHIIKAYDWYKCNVKVDSKALAQFFAPDE